ncbi:glutamine synthetase, catalytic domain protein [Burkholderia ambifaria AMMD]|uniref:L-glutamine synthetase n=1 Tax=Burkholderia ambifaria (strain ATCC BAA-244 / DSM 16087 / CCUG 44356 / LMG 19182 / AMMD) TaxID=339670 RepID=Q0BDL6_BURCM|nr:glutamine synthetase family protein [Burkholderia ambifaria]ABI87757.1 L-glutamine synthetase [Burkholderia ambifaria AMMD]AJY21870.1 glutamine synthetase, catalytic domain protein [Burkholderia ambifaria AMMD]MBR7929245.1 glutamine synthetase [Burkholderia ambifaria]PEH65060.1 glutamine synthetase [Burkholderia ambifaria]PRF98998.1 glutamine synthetase [Burkholderia ambifaria]
MQPELSEFLRQHRITEVEAIIPDMAGIARGKIIPRNKFESGESMRLPQAVMVQTVTGDYPEDGTLTGVTDPDMVCVPDPSTICLVPWAVDPTAQVIHDCVHFDGSPVEISPRYVLRRVLDLYKAKGWQPVVAPELEFYLVDMNADPDLPLRPPIGRTGRAETGRQSYSIEAVNEFDPLFEDIYEYCEMQGLDIETLIHEVGAAQMEINFVHGDALSLADQVFLFKRTVREAALRHNMYATFMAKPMEGEPGSAMHIHQSLADVHTGRNLFAEEGGVVSPMFHSYLAGLQKYTPALMPIFAPYINSYRRLSRFMAAPINVQWGYDNRTVGFRIPQSTPVARRIENRIPGVDCNPYLAFAATLAAGYLGLTQQLAPTEPIASDGYDLPYQLPRNLEEGISLMAACTPLAGILGDKFVKAYLALKETEYEAFFRVISSWERRHLLLHV